jgi:hypothetical protein
MASILIDNFTATNDGGGPISENIDVFFDDVAFTVSTPSFLVSYTESDRAYAVDELFYSYYDPIGGDVYNVYADDSNPFAYVTSVTPVEGTPVNVLSGTPTVGTPAASSQGILFAYEVKYRLDYSTVEGRQWRLEILVENYSGDVIPLTSQGEPCEIVWDGGDEIETPIIGSVAYLNFWQQTGQDLSEFFTPSENEFFVKLSFYNGSSYETFWKGYIMQDEYTEQINTNPFSVNVKAFDKIALLTRPFDYATTDATITPHDIIRECIRYTRLEFDYIDFTNMKTTSVANYATSSILVQHNLRSDSLINDTTFISYKDALESVCRSYNARLFQRNGKLYFVSLQAYNAVSNVIKAHSYTYLDQAWTHSDITISNILEIPTDINELGQNFTRTSTPAIKSYNRDYEVQPKNLIYNGYFALDATGWTTDGNTSIKTDNSQKGGKSIFSLVANVSDGTFDGASEAVKNSTYRVFETSTLNTNALQTFIHNLFEVDNTGASSEFVWLNGVFSFYYFIDEVEDGNTFDLRFSIERESSPNYYYNLDTGYLDTSVPFLYKELNTTKTRVWTKYEATLRLQVPATGVPLTFRMYRTNGAGTNVNMYFDDFRFTLTPYKANDTDWSAERPKANYNVSQDDNLNTLEKSDSCLFGVTSVEVVEDALFSEYELGNKTLGQYFVLTNTLEKVDLHSKTLDGSYAARELQDWCMYSLGAIYSAPTQRYEGTFSDRRTVTSIPLGLTDITSISYAGYESNAVMVLTRLSMKTKSNVNDCQWLTVSPIPNTSALDFTIETTYKS